MFVSITATPQTQPQTQLQTQLQPSQPRVSPGALETATRIKELLDGGLDAKTLASKIDKKESWIRSNLKLLDFFESLESFAANGWIDKKLVADFKVRLMLPSNQPNSVSLVMAQEIVDAAIAKKQDMRIHSPRLLSMVIAFVIRFDETRGCPSDQPPRSYGAMKEFISATRKVQKVLDVNL